MSFHLTALSRLGGAIKEFKTSTALGMDWLEIQFLRDLDEADLLRLAALLNRIEHLVLWPGHLLLNIIVLMGKPGGGFRPIALMPMLYRLWAKIRKVQIQEWDIEHRGPWDAAVRGSSALRAGLLSAFGDELSSLSKEEVAAILWDMDKFYDNINIIKLLDEVYDTHYPLRVSSLGLQMHLAPRVIKAYDSFSLIPTLPTNSIIAGCTQSTYFARVLLYQLLFNVSTGNPTVDFRTFVDDIKQTAYGRGAALEQVMVEAGHELHQGLTELGNIVSVKKTTILTSKLSLSKGIAGRLRARGIYFKVASYAKDLGIGTTAGVRRITRFLDLRIRSVRNRVNRIKILNRIDQRAGRLYNTGALPQASYGKEAMGVSPSQLQSLRALAADSVSSATKGQCTTTLIWVALGQENDPATKVVLDQVRAWFSVVEGADMEQVSRAWWSQKLTFTKSGNPWGTVKGPMGAVIATLRQVDWLGITPFKWVGHDGSEWAYHPTHSKDISLHPMLDGLRSAVERIVWGQASNHHCGRGLAEGCDVYSIQKHLKHMRHGNPKDASLMMTIASAGAWSQARKFQAGLVDSPLCPHCGEEEQDDLHMCWTCNKLMDLNDSRVKKTNHLVFKAQNGGALATLFLVQGAYTQELDP